MSCTNNAFSLLLPPTLTAMGKYILFKIMNLNVFNSNANCFEKVACLRRLKRSVLFKTNE